jgi:hypothetical protein
VQFLLFAGFIAIVFTGALFLQRRERAGQDRTVAAH